MIQEAHVVPAINFDALASVVDGISVTETDSATSESAYSRLANEAHALRMENQRLRDVIGTINCALEAINLRGM